MPWQMRPTGINIGEALRTAATRLLDMGQDDLQLLLVQKPDDKLDLLIYDPMPGGSGLLEQMLSRWQELIATAKDCWPVACQGCETACYSCLKTFRNQFHHAMLEPPQGPRTDGCDWTTTRQAYRDIVPLFEEENPGDGTPSNKPEARLPEPAARTSFPGRRMPETDCHNAPGFARNRTGFTSRRRWPSISTA